MPFLVFLLHVSFFDRAAAPDRTVTACCRTEPGCAVAAARSGRPVRDAGMSTAEYAVGTVAAVAFAGVLYAVISSPATRDIIASVVERALSVPF